MRRASLPILGAAALVAWGCQAPSAGPGVFRLGPADDVPPVVAMRAGPQGPEPEVGAALALGLGASAPLLADRTLLALPAAWTQALCRLAHATAMRAPREATLRKDVELVPTGTGAYRANNPFPGALRPAAGYQLAVELWNGDTTTGTLAAQKAVTVGLAGGTNNVTVTLDPAVALAITGFSPTAGWFGDAVSITGQGFSLFPANNRLMLDATPVALGSSTATTMAGTVPAIGPGSYQWEACVGGAKAKSASDFTVTPLDGAPVVLSGVSSRQQDPAIAAGAADFVVAWVDDRAGSKVDVLGHLLSPARSAPGPDQAISVDPSTTQRQPSLSYDPGRNQYLAVWQDGPSATDIKGRLAGADGAGAGAMFDVAAATAVQANPHTAFAPAADRHLVVWSDLRNGSNTVIHTQLVRGGGGLAGPNRALSTSADNADNPNVAWSAAAGRFLVVWDETPGGAGLARVRGRLVAGTGAPDGVPFDIALDASFHQVQPAVAADEATGGFLVTWVSQAKPHEVKLQRVTGTGALAGAPVLVTRDLNEKEFPRLAWIPWLGKALVVWGVDIDSNKASADYDTWGRYFEPDGAPWGSPVLLAGGAGDQRYPEVAALAGAKRAAVAYHHWVSGNTSSVRAQLLK